MLIVNCNLSKAHLPRKKRKKKKKSTKPPPGSLDYTIWGKLLIVIQETDMVEAMEDDTLDNCWESRLSSKEIILLAVYKSIILTTV